MTAYVKFGVTSMHKKSSHGSFAIYFSIETSELLFLFVLFRFCSFRNVKKIQLPLRKSNNVKGKISGKVFEWPEKPVFLGVFLHCHLGRLRKLIKPGCYERSKGSPLVSSLPKLAHSTNSLEQNFVQAAVEPMGNKKKQWINSNKNKTPAEADDK